MKAVVVCTAILLASTPSLAHETQEKKLELQDKSPSTSLFMIGGKAVAVEPAQSAHAEASNESLPVYRYIQYSEYTCDVDWQHRCEGSVVVQAPTGYQVCRALFSVTYQGGHDAWHAETPTEWYLNDPQSPDRFRAVEFKIHAFGSGSIFNQLGSRITLQEIGVSYISADADNFQRYAAGCWMPSHD